MSHFPSRDKIRVKACLESTPDIVLSTGQSGTRTKPEVLVV